MNEAINYAQSGDYLLPEIKLNEPPKELTEPLGRYARMRKAFLKEHKTISYNAMLLAEKLFPHLRETEAAANARLEQVMNTLTMATTLPDKQTNPIGWTAMMNTLKAQAEEMVLNELIYA